MTITHKSALNNNVLEFNIDEDFTEDTHIEEGLSKKVITPRRILEKFLQKWHCVKFNLNCEAKFQVNLEYFR